MFCQSCLFCFFYRRKSNELQELEINNEDYIRNEFIETPIDKSVESLEPLLSDSSKDILLNSNITRKSIR